MASHGVARTVRTRTEEQKQQELVKIKKYRDLEDQVRAHTSPDHYTPEVLDLTTKLLRLNPEYYTIWNVRRRLLISGLLCKPSAGSLHSKESPNSSQTATTTTYSAESSSSSSNATPPNPASRTTGRNGTTADQSGNLGDPSVPSVAKTADGSAGQQNDLEVLRSELGFTVPLLMEFPKCYWIWDYRSWLLQAAIERLEPPVARQIWEEELGLDTKMLTKDRRNFHAWGYRRHVVKHLESAALGGKSMVEFEFDFTTKMIRVDLSNFSAWHNRSNLIPRLLGERSSDDAARRKFFDQELALIREALNVGPEDQSLWYYHQFLMLNLVEQVDQPSITGQLTVRERVAYLKQEIADIKDLSEDYDDCKLIFENLIDYTTALSALETRQPSPTEKVELEAWLLTLRTLDPMRQGRWDDMEKDLALTRQ